MRVTTQDRPPSCQLRSATERWHDACNGLWLGEEPTGGWSPGDGHKQAAGLPEGTTMKLELSIKVDYLPGWGAWEGIRELVQNGVDAETEFHAPLTVRHRDDVLVIENEGATLPHEALLLGHTTKLDRGDLRGKFGEGLKLGVLALIRSGHEVKIRSGSEVWVPSIQRSEKFDAEVLTFDIAKGRKDAVRVQIEVHGVSKEDWKLMRGRFLFLDKRPSSDIVPTYYGKLLLNKEMIGQLFVQGIYVGRDTDYSYGYDLDSCELDRDRKMVDKYSARWQINRIWMEAVASRPDLASDFVKLLEAQKGDVEGMDDWAVKSLDKTVAKSIADAFVQQHGEDAIPVKNLAESEDISHLGKRGIVVSKSLSVVLQQTLGTMDEVKKSLAEEVCATYSWHDLSDAERANLKRAVELVSCVELSLTLDRIEVVDFRDQNLAGLHHGTGRISIARDALLNQAATLRIMVHEVAHDHGGDGSKEHVSAIERIWSGIVELLG